MKWFWGAPHECDVHGHMFEARYDYQGPGTNARVRTDDPADAIKFMRAAGTQTYVKDICVYCGASVDRDQFGAQDDPHPLRKVVG